METKIRCDYCQKMVVASAIVSHEIRCQRRMRWCGTCGIATRGLNDHYDSGHHSDALAAFVVKANG